MESKNLWRIPFVWGALAMILMLLAAFAVRTPEFKRVSGAQNLEATYHVLLTVTALDESPIANHWLLPTVTLGRAADKHISWGATIPTKTGDYVYTSFTSAGFLAPYLWFKALGQAPSARNLATFNALLGAATACGLYLLLFSLLRFNGYAQGVAATAALLGSTIGIFSREALLSHGVIYWSHSLYQPILLVSLFLLFHYLRDEARRPFFARALMVAAFLGPMTEWTGYIFNAGIIGLLWFRGTRAGVSASGSQALALRIFFVSAAACVVTVAYFSLAGGVGPAIGALLRRFLGRSAATGTTVDLIAGYGLSYGVFLLTLFLILAMAFFAKPADASSMGDDGKRKVITSLVFLAACIPLLENLVMLQHATQFSFDRLKFIFPAAMVLAFAFARFDVKGRAVLLVLIAVACANGFKSYQRDMMSYSAWAKADAGNRQLAAAVLAKVDRECALFSSKIAVRAYSNLLFHRGIHESMTLEESSALLADSKACALVYLDGDWAFTDLPRYTRVDLKRPDGSSEVFTLGSAP